MPQNFSNLGKFSEINKQFPVKSWLTYRSYSSVWWILSFTFNDLICSLCNHTKQGNKQNQLCWFVLTSTSAYIQWLTFITGNLEILAWLSIFIAIFYKGQLISKTNCHAMDSSKKRTNEFVFTTMRRVFVRFLEESLGLTICFRNYLTFSRSKSFGRFVLKVIVTRSWTVKTFVWSFQDHFKVVKDVTCSLELNRVKILGYCIFH